MNRNSRGRYTVQYIDAINTLIDYKILTGTLRLSPKYKTRLDESPLCKALVDNLTSFLQYDASYLVRIHCLLQELEEQPVCKTCNSILKMPTNGPKRYQFADYCGSKCFASVDSIKHKRIKTNLQKHGTINPMSCEHINKKRKATNFKRYGVENAMLCQSVSDKRKNTNLERYGNISGTCDEVISKRKQTNLMRYGVDNAGLHPELIKKRKETNIARYGVENVFELDEFQQKARDTLQRNGGIGFANKQTARIIKDTINSTYGNSHYHTSQISDKTLQLLSNYDWMFDQYVTNKLPGDQIASNIGVVPSTVYKYLTIHGIANCSNQGTSFGERELAEFIQDVYKGNVTLNDRTLINPKELDIYLPDLKLAFEYNGVFWHGELNGKTKTYHKDKTTSCSNHDVRLIHVFSNEWDNKKEIVKSRIQSMLGKSTRIYARLCNVIKVDNSQRRDFFNLYHIQGDVNSSESYGLIYNNQLVACMSFGKSRYKKDVDFELLRFANTLNHNVVGGASKLFKHFTRQHPSCSVISYCDLRWGTGNMYKQIGFEYQHTSAPNYFYFDTKDACELFSRVSFQKHKLIDKLDTFDPHKTEWENMVDNNYDRIWDCGNSVWLYKGH